MSTKFSIVAGITARAGITATAVIATIAGGTAVIPMAGGTRSRLLAPGL